MTGRKRGRPKVPTPLRVLMGNPGNRPINQDEPKPKPLMPHKPKMIKGEALKEWQRISKKLQELGLLTEVDGAALAAYCKCYERWIEAEEFLDRLSHDKEDKPTGLMFKTPSGYMQQLPQVSISQTYAKLMALYLSKFGLSPADRAGMVAPRSAEKISKLSRTLSG